MMDSKQVRAGILGPFLLPALGGRRLPLLSHGNDGREPHRSGDSTARGRLSQRQLWSRQPGRGRRLPLSHPVAGHGTLKVQYTAARRHQEQINGPTLSEPQQGQLQIVLLPDGKAEFHPQLTPQP